MSLVTLILTLISIFFTGISMISSFFLFTFILFTLFYSFISIRTKFLTRENIHFKVKEII
jgi:hypothetical protein